MADVAQTFALNPYAAEQAKNERLQKYAELLQSQGLAPNEKFSYNGIDVPPSAAGALAKGLQLGVSGYLQGRGMRNSEDLADKMTTERKADMDKIVSALQGTPGAPEVPGSVTATQADVNDREMGPAAANPIALGQQLATGGGMGEGANIGAPAKAAVPGSVDAANAVMVASKFPDLQTMGLQGAIKRGDLERNQGLVNVLLGNGSAPTAPGAATGLSAPVQGAMGGAMPQGAPMASGSPMPAQAAPQGQLMPQQKAILQTMASAGAPAQDVAKAMQDMIKSNIEQGIQTRGQDMTARTAERGQDLTSQQAKATLAQADQHWSGLSGQQKSDAQKADAEFYDKTGQHILSTPNQATPAKTGPLVETASPEQARKLVAEKPQAVQSVNSIAQNIDLRTKAINNLLKAPGLDQILGPYNGRLLSPNMTENATNAQALMDTIKNQASVQALNDMRAMSKTGGAVGNVSEAEWPILQSQYEALQQTHNPKQFRTALEDLKKTYARIKASHTDAFKSIYGGSPSSIDDLLSKYGDR